MEFKSFSKIEHLDKISISITQKMHGTNAQICIWEEDGVMHLKCASRSRWLIPGDDNHGFAKFVYENKDEFIEKLGVGRHYGEWCGPRINAGEGLKEKTLFLFNWRRWDSVELPPCTKSIPLILSTERLPILYGIEISFCEFDVRNISDQCLSLLKDTGSMAVEGYMKPEGIVIDIGGKFYKKVFDESEIKWKQAEKKEYTPRERMDVSHLLQPLRLEKLLSRDEIYLREYPKSLSTICALYVKDLEEENQIEGDEDEVKGIKKSLGSNLFKFVKEFISQRT